MPDAVKIYDTTLRDGCQGAGVSLSLQDKLDIAQRLDAFCVDYVEGGWPGANPKDTQFFAALRKQPLRNARLTAFGSTRRAETRAEDDATLRLLLEAETPTVALVAKGRVVDLDGVRHSVSPGGLQPRPFATGTQGGRTDTCVSGHY